jgi:hypothetical protein
MTKKTHLKRLIVFFLTVLITPFFSAKLALAQVDACDEPVLTPSTGFVVNNLSGTNPQSPFIRLRFASFSNAQYTKVSNYPDFPLSDNEGNTLTVFFPLGYGEDNEAYWSVLSGYGPKKVYVQFVNSCKLMPNPVEPIVIDLTYWPTFCDQPVVAPSGGLKATVVGGNTVTSPNIQLELVSGSAAFVQVSNSPDFSTATVESVGYGYGYTINWTLASGYGNKMVYVRFLNDCESQPTATIVVNVNYPNPTCVSAINTNSLMITSAGPTNIRVGNPTRVTIVPHGNNANWVQLSNSFSFSSSTWYKISDNQSISWKLPTGTGSKTVWAQYWYKDDGCPNIKASYAVSISFAVSR